MESVRFSARSVKAQRSRLGLSAADYGKLVGVSGLTMMWKHVEAVILLPVVVVMVVVPASILYFTGIGGTALQHPAPWNTLMLVGGL